jgi:MoxR-like ATPase
MARRKITPELLKDFTGKVYENMIADPAVKTITKAEVIKIAETYLVQNPLDIAPATLAWNTIKDFKVGRGIFTIGEFAKDFSLNTVRQSQKSIPKPKINPVAIQAIPTPSNVATSFQGTEENFIPAIDPLYFSDDVFDTLISIFQTGRFFPIYVSGLSGVGKTTGAEQAAATLKRELITISVTAETNEDDLLGGFRLVAGETVWFDGPVTKAMKRGAILLLDEVDLASPKVMALQPVLSGKNLFLKKVNEVVTPAPGFTIVATANTKGQGDDTGKFIGTGNMNEAFLDRFPVSVEADYPKESVEVKILTKIWKTQSEVNDRVKQTIKNLVRWANMTRDSYKQELIDDVISVRRTVNIVNAFSIFGSIKTALDLTMNRFDDLTKETLLDLYTKIDPYFGEEPPAPEVPVATKSGPVETGTYDGSDIPF